MRTTTKAACLLAFLVSITAAAKSQDLRSFNQNASRSNHSRMMNTDSWSFGINTGGSFGLKSNDNTLFRGNSIATKMIGRYYFGNIGLGFTSGVTPGTISDNSLNRFITDRKFPRDQLQITKANPFNSYLLFGPSFRFGGKVYVNADIQGGLFFNNSGAVNIIQQGAARSLYRFDGGDKNMFPGFSGSVSINYPLNRTTHFFINTDYLQSKSSIRLFDPQGGIDIPAQVNRDIKLLTAGIGIVKSFGGKRESSSGMATGRKHIGHVKYEDIKAREAGSGLDTGRIIYTDNNNGVISPRDAQSGLPTGRRRYQPGQPVYGNITRQANESCGPVILTTTNPDGTTEQRTFACPADAAQYNQRISMNVTTPKQTQGATFGEKVNAGLHAAGSALSQGAARGFISGIILWASDNPSGVTTNQTAAVSSVGNLAGGGSGAAAASYAATGRMSNTGNQQGVVTTIYAREASSGMATGRRSRDASSGMATGRRQYEPVFNEENNNTCTDCAVNAKLIAHELTHVVQQSGGPVNNNRMREGGLCGSTTHFFVTLVNADNGQQVVRTKPDSCGNFWFANVPVGNYVVRVKGEVLVQKAYEVTINKDGKYDVAGEIVVGDDQLIVQLNNTMDDSDKQNAKVIVRGWNPEKKELIAGDASKDAQPGMLLGGALPGGAVLSSAFVAGTPIGGIIVKGGKNPGGSFRTTQTNGYGEFEFTDLERGNYTISAELKYNMDEETIITVAGDAAENIVTSESNLKGEAARKGWDGTIKGNAKADNDQPQLRAQNNNTVRSNRTELKSILIEADLDGDGEYETDVTNKLNDEIVLDANGQETTPQQKAGISTSRSNIRNRSSLQVVSDGLYVSYGDAVINNKDVKVKTVLKTKHDTAKNSVGNIR